MPPLRAKNAPRPPATPWHASARGAWLAVALLAGGTASADITSAHYDAPTTRYAHGVLGDAVEWGALVMTLGDGRQVTATLPDDLVFEDLAPRLADVDNDGTPEVITVEAAQTLGARLAIWDETGRIAATPHIGQRNRWLAPVAVADLDGDGHIEIAYVDRPHLAKTLRVWRFRDNTLTEIASLDGVTNHRIGWDYIEGGLRDCGTGPEMILASGDWQTLLAVRLDKTLTVRSLGRYSPDAIRAALECS